MNGTRDERKRNMEGEMWNKLWDFIELVARGNTEITDLERIAEELLEEKVNRRQNDNCPTCGSSDKNVRMCGGGLGYMCDSDHRDCDNAWHNDINCIASKGGL